jgi:hypothetical protein
MLAKKGAAVNTDETPEPKTVEIEESSSPVPPTGQPPTQRPKGLLWVGAIAAVLVVVTLACLWVAGIAWLQWDSNQPLEAALFQSESVAPVAPEEALQPQGAPVPQEGSLSLEDLPMLQPEVAASMAAGPAMLRSAPGAPPTIEYFLANPPLIDRGQCTTLFWGSVLGASWAGIEPGIGGIGTPGNTVVCPSGTTTYILSAEGPGGRSYASTTVSVGATGNRGTVVLESEGPLDGYRSNDNRGSTRHDILAANAEINPAGVEVVWRGFMSFDLSAIPWPRSIRAAELRFFQVRVGGNPYGKLGRLVLEHVAYGARLEDAAFHQAPMDRLVLDPQTQRKTWYVVTAPKLRQWIAEDIAAGRGRFQVRIRWEQETDGDGEEDWASIESPENFFGTGNAPELTVTYGP